MKKLLGLSLLVGLLFLSGCAITHEYGPYMGKVVEKGTGEPIEGAVVFMQFHTGTGNIGGMTSYYADAVETLTDGQGDFLIPSHRITSHRLLHGWVEDGHAIIFKPGFGVFPRHRETTVSDPNGIIPANKTVVIELPRLNTKEERKENLDSLWAGSGVPIEKHMNLNRLESIERSAVGLKPY